MGLIFLLIGILLFGFALWLWQLIRTYIYSEAVTTSLFPEQEVKTYSISKFSLNNYRLQAIDFLLHRVPWLPVLYGVMYLMLVGFIGIGLILFIDRRIALSTFILIVIVVFSTFLIRVIFVVRRLHDDYSFLPPPPLLPQTEVRVARKVIMLSGEVTLPKQVYANRNKSLKISVELMPAFEIGSPIEEHLSMQDKGTGTSVTLRVQQEAGEQFLQVELQAPAFTVAGEQKQKHLLNFVNPHKISYQWTLFCPNSGNHPVFLIFSLVTSSDIFKLGETTHEIRVRQLDHLSQTKVRLITAVTTIIGFVSTVIGIIVNLPTLFHLFGH